MSNKKSRPEVNTATKLISRVIRYMLHYYKYLFLLVVVCILITAIATVVGATFPQTLVDDYITPMLANGSRDFGGLAKDLVQLACVMAVGVITAFTYNRIMVQCESGNHAPSERRSVCTDGGAAHQIFRHPCPRRHHVRVHQRCGYPAAAAEPEYSADYQLGDYHGGNPGDHADSSPALTVISILTAFVMLFVTSRFSRLSGKYYIPPAD